VTAARSKSASKFYRLAAIFFFLSILGALIYMLLLPSWSEEKTIPFAVKYAAEFKIEPELALAVVKKESSFDSDARGAAGEIGLMQIMPATAAQIAMELEISNFTLDNLSEPGLNVRFGSYWLSRMREYEGTDNPWAFRLAEYNAGAPRVDEWRAKATDPAKAESFLDAVAIPSVKSYVRDVLEYWTDYKARRVILIYIENENANLEKGKGSR
jgi:soluble lytic murein transglycosylase